MHSLNRTLVGLSLMFTCGCLAVAQEQSGSAIPKVLQITREYTKPGKNGAAHDKSESAFVEAMARSKWPTHYIGMTSLSGKQRALFLTSYQSFAAWQKDGDDELKNAALSGSLERANVADGDLLDSVDQGVFYFREEMSLRPLADLSHTRFLDVTVFHVRPGKGKQWEDLGKIAKEAYGKANPEAHWGMFELVYGGENGTYLLLTARKSLTEVDHEFGMEKQFNAAVGEETLKKMDELFGEAVDSSQSQLFAYNPAMSYVDDSWIKSDPDFWKPAPKLVAKSAGAKAATDEKVKK
jgi:hypothetical protein